MTQQDERLTLNVPEAGRLLGLSREASYMAAARGDIPTLRIGRRLLVPKAGLIRMIDAAAEGSLETISP